MAINKDISNKRNNWSLKSTIKTKMKVLGMFLVTSSFLLNFCSVSEQSLINKKILLELHKKVDILRNYDRIILQDLDTISIQNQDYINKHTVDKKYVRTENLFNSLELESPKNKAASLSLLSIVIFFLGNSFLLASELKKD